MQNASSPRPAVHRTALTLACEVTAATVATAATAVLTLAVGMVFTAMPVRAQRAQIGNGRPNDLATGLGESDVFFSGSDGAAGVELWRFDGATTTLLRDVKVGPASAYPVRITRFAPASPQVFFVANDGAHGRELFYYDGSAGSARAPLLDIDPQPGKGSDPAGLTVLATGSMLVFSANEPAGGRELWQSDGTAGGTTQVADLEPGAIGSAPSGFTVLGGTVLFAATTSAEGTELWRSDGTAAGTQRVLDIAPGTPSSTPQGLVAFGGFVWFAATTHQGGRELWRSNGTAVGTTQVGDIGPGAEGSDPQDLVAGSAAVAFTADDGTNGRQLWLVDAAGTLQRVSTFTGGRGTTIANVTADGSEFWFTADDGTSGQEPWRTSASGAQLVVDLRPGAEGSAPRHLVPWQGDVIARADDGVAGEELYRITPSGTAALLRDVRPGPRGSDASAPIAFGTSSLLFAAEDGSKGIELWQTQGTPASTVRLTDLDAQTPLPQARLDFDAAALRITVMDTRPGNPVWLLVGMAARNPLPYGPLRGAILLDPTQPFLFVGIGAANLSGETTVVLAGPPPVGVPIGVQAFALDAQTTAIESSGLVTWSTGTATLRTAAAVSVTAEGKFDDDSGEYTIKVDRTDSTTAQAYVAVIAVDDEGGRTLVDSSRIKAGGSKSFEGDIAELMSPVDPSDAPATSLEVRLYPAPPGDKDLDSGTLLWESYC